MSLLSFTQWALKYGLSRPEYFWSSGLGGSIYNIDSPLLYSIPECILKEEEARKNKPKFYRVCYTHH